MGTRIRSQNVESRENNIAVQNREESKIDVLAEKTILPYKIGKSLKLMYWQRKLRTDFKKKNFHIDWQIY
jgi:hypothetical protein